MKKPIIQNIENRILMNNTEKPIYGPMCRKITLFGPDSLQSQYDQAEINLAKYYPR